MAITSEIRAEEILESLDNEQRAVALATRGPVCVIAGAGTGKTRAITHRIAYAAAINVMDPHKVLALTFTARAAGEMRMRQSEKCRVQRRAHAVASGRQLLPL